MKASRAFKPQYGLAGHNVALWEIEVERELCVLQTLASFGHCVYDVCPSPSIYRNQHSVIMYSPSCYSKPVRLTV